MSWGIDFKADIFLSRQSYESKGMLEDAIREKEKDIEYCRQQLLMFASSNVKEIIPDDWKEEPLRYLQNEVNMLTEQIKEQSIELFKLNLYLDNYEES